MLADNYSDETLLEYSQLVSDKDLKLKLFRDIKVGEIFYIEKSDEAGRWCKRVKPYRYNLKLVNAIDIHSGELYFFSDSQQIYVVAGK